MGTSIRSQVALVAKPVSMLKSNISWRLSFYDQEKAMLTRAGQMKPIIKLLKVNVIDFKLVKNC